MTDSELARNFLLGLLDNRRREQVAKRLFTDEDFYREVLAAEADLLDALVGGELSPDDGRRFEEGCLASASQRRKLQFARALRRENSGLVAEQTDPTPALGKLERPSRNRRLGRLVPALAAAVAGVAILLAAWFQQQELRRQIQTLQVRQTELERQLESRPAEGAPEAVHRSDSEPTPPPPIQEAKPPQSARLSLFLASAVLRGETPLAEIRVPPNAGPLDLKVEVGSPTEASAYQLVVSNSDGRAVFQRMNLEVRRVEGVPLVEIAIPTNILRGGVHEVELSAQLKAGGLEPVSYSYFRVVRTR